MRAVHSALVLPLLLAGCGLLSGAKVYPLSYDAALGKLARADPPAFIGGGAVVDWRTSRPDPDTVAWTLLDERDRALMKFTVKVIPTDGKPGVTVKTDVLPPDGALHDRFAKGFAAHPEIHNLYLAALDEDVDATLTGRSFDYSRIANATTAAVFANLGAIRQEMDQAGRAHEKAERRQPAAETTAQPADSDERDADRDSDREPERMGTRY